MSILTLHQEKHMRRYKQGYSWCARRQVQATVTKVWSDAVLLGEAGICRQAADE
jgi:hypothetical protein